MWLKFGWMWVCCASGVLMSYQMFWHPIVRIYFSLKLVACESLFLSVLFCESLFLAWFLCEVGFYLYSAVRVYFSLFYFVGIYFSISILWEFMPLMFLEMFQCFLCIIFEDVLFEVMLKSVIFFRVESLC